MGWERSVLGYPTTDQTATPDGVGRYNHFSGTGGSSIYWIPGTGAHEVRGAIHQLWSQLGWERSPLGYPTSDETDTAHHATRVSGFQHGDIYWDAGRGAYEVYPRPTFPPGDPIVVGRWAVPAHNAGIDGLHAALLHTNALWFLSTREPADPANPGPVRSPSGTPRSSTSPATPRRRRLTTVRTASCPTSSAAAMPFLPDGRLLVVGGDREDQNRIHSLHVVTPGGPR
jgi:hypothetical protein